MKPRSCRTATELVRSAGFTVKGSCGYKIQKSEQTQNVLGYVRR